MGEYNQGLQASKWLYVHMEATVDRKGRECHVALSTPRNITFRVALRG